MKKIFFIVVLVILASVGLATGVFYATEKNTQPSTYIATQRTTQEPSNTLPTASPQSPIGIPQKIQIPKLGVNAIVEQVGKDTAGRMAIPQKWTNTGWYKYGPKPGEIGNAAIDGHVDTPQGKPSVFADLTKIKPGDHIIIIDENGTELTFSVTDIETVELAQFPLDQVFGKTHKKRLNLITCGGIWDKQKKDYSQRTIAYAELIE